LALLGEYGFVEAAFKNIEAAGVDRSLLVLGLAVLAAFWAFYFAGKLLGLRRFAVSDKHQEDFIKIAAALVALLIPVLVGLYRAALGIAAALVELLAIGAASLYYLKQEAPKARKLTKKARKK
jgi:hypothetical protein